MKFVIEVVVLSVISADKKNPKMHFFPYNPSMHRVVGGSFQNAESVSLLFELFEEAFEEEKGYMGVMGAIHDTHIPIKALTQNHEQYINRKGFFSVQLQVICHHHHHHHHILYLNTIRFKAQSLWGRVEIVTI